MMASANFGGDVHKTVEALNQMGVSQFVFAIIPTQPGGTTDVVFRFEHYPRYQQFCERMGQKPVSHKEFFAMGTRL